MLIVLQSGNESTEFVFYIAHICRSVVHSVRFCYVTSVVEEYMLVIRTVQGL